MIKRLTVDAIDSGYERQSMRYKDLHPVKPQLMLVAILLCSSMAGMQTPGLATTPELTESETPTLAEVKADGALRSSYREPAEKVKVDQIPKANLESFRAEIEPMLKQACYDCHGSETAEGEFRVDTLDPDLLHGEDVDWWLEVSAAITNGEMPPEDGPELGDTDRTKIVEWLSSEIQLASHLRRSEHAPSSFRRMTRYEYNYALQDLLGLPFHFAKDLPPDPVSADGFKNSSEMLQMSDKQYADYLEINRNALNRATVRGERPEVFYWGISAERAATRKRKTRQQLDAEIEQNAKKEEIDKSDEAPALATQAEGRRREGRGDRGGRGGRGGSRGTHYLNTNTGETTAATWSFRRALHAWAPTMTRPEVPEPNEYIGLLPAGQQLVVDLGNQLPDEGTLRVRFRASRHSDDNNGIPSVALEFGWQGSNNSKASVRISKHDLEIDAPPGEPQFYQWDIPLSEIYPRNPVRKTVELSAPKLTNPSEYIRLNNLRNFFP